ncbi:MAG: hypothetical protein FJ403_09045 [Verrucomicrobia bacterium]|nr:hypothetical protein [Verrucomicrobiota bacterium]
MKHRSAPRQFALCLGSGGAEDLIPRKVYEVLPDEAAATKEFLRVIDESGEDYLYPAKLFVLLVLPRAVERALVRAAPKLHAA